MTDFADMIAGYHRFRSGDWLHHRQRWERLAVGQDPKVLVIACSDSRIDPATVFDARPGEMFVIRNVANLVPPFEVGGLYHGVSSALEFAVTQLEVPEIIVMGHGQCGGIAASLSRRFAGKAPGEGGFINSWISMLDGARDSVVTHCGHGPEAARALELETVRLSLRNLGTFPFVKRRQDAGALRLIGAYFAIADGILHVLDDETGEFRPA